MPSTMVMRAPVLLVCVLASSVARADPATQARFHDQVARREYSARHFENALREFFLEQRVSPNPRIAFNIALCFQGLKRDKEAFHYYSQYLASDDSDPKRRSYAERSVDALKRTLALVSVQSTPAGAEIYFDRKELGSFGQTPALVAIDPGEHQVIGERAGYRPALGTIIAHAGQQVTLELQSERIVGQLRVSGAVAGSVVVRDGSGKTVVKGALPLVAVVPPGSYEITVRAVGYQAWSGVAVVEADKGSDVTALPQLAPAPTGDITVTSNVPGALVELNGQPAGFAPAVLAGVPIGSQSLRVRAPSMLPWTGRVLVTANERDWLTVTLQEPTSVRRSPTTYVFGGIGVSALAVGGVFGILAAQAHSDFQNAEPGADHTALRRQGVRMNTVADVSFLTGAVALSAAIVLFFATASTHGERSSASVVRSKR